MLKGKLIIGHDEVLVTEARVRSAQRALLEDKLHDNDRALIDAIISHFICLRPPWLVDDKGFEPMGGLVSRET